jgi:hypothetical protein
MVAHRESATLAQQFIHDTCSRQHIAREQLTIHADRGSAMTSPSPAVVGRPGQPQRRARGRDAEPRSDQASASRTIFRLYSTVNRRRVAFATTSIAGPTTACSNALITLQS